ncbi:MAG: hypothetical protein MZU97_25050 [Bacillus subtilis]|nr:hypothetical protein [Bacillus subtilis]
MELYEQAIFHRIQWRRSPHFDNRRIQSFMKSKITWDDVHAVWRFVKEHEMHVHVFTKHAIYLSIGIRSKPCALIQNNDEHVRVVDIGYISQTDEPVYEDCGS